MKAQVLVDFVIERTATDDKPGQEPNSESWIRESAKTEFEST